MVRIDLPAVGIQDSWAMGAALATSTYASPWYKVRSWQLVRLLVSAVRCIFLGLFDLRGHAFTGSFGTSGKDMMCGTWHHGKEVRSAGLTSPGRTIAWICRSPFGFNRRIRCRMAKNPVLNLSGKVKVPPQLTKQSDDLEIPGCSIHRKGQGALLPVLGGPPSGRRSFDFEEAFACISGGWASDVFALLGADTGSSSASFCICFTAFCA
mmetsp:Transcript_88654/g.141126  ORF Transcript_88654/g.141126 Transcript_88654/m.141126 type:complete len:209 (+) Transcript_88654:31-657(+)